MANDNFRGENQNSNADSVVNPSQNSTAGASALANRELVQIGPGSPDTFSLDRLNEHQTVNGGDGPGRPPVGGADDSGNDTPTGENSGIGNCCVLTPCEPELNDAGQLISPNNTNVEDLHNWAQRCQWVRSLAIQLGEQNIVDMVDRNERSPKIFINMRFISVIGHQGRGKSQFAEFVQFLHIDDNIIMNADAFYRVVHDFARSLAFKNDAFEALMVEIPSTEIVSALERHGVDDEEVIEVAVSAHDATIAKVDIVTEHIVDVATPLTTLVSAVNAHIPSINTIQEDGIFGTVLRNDQTNETEPVNRTLFLGAIDLCCVSNIHTVFTLFNEQRDLVNRNNFAVDITQSGDHQALLHMTVNVDVIRGFAKNDDTRLQNQDPANNAICDDIVDRLNDILVGASVVPAHYVARGNYIEFSCNIFCFAPILLSTLMINGYTRLSALNENTKVSFSPYIFKTTVNLGNGTLKGGQSAAILAFLGTINQLGEIANGGAVVEYRVDTPIDQFMNDAFEVLKGSNICLLAIDKEDDNWITTLRLRDRLMTQKASETLENIVTMIGHEANKLYRQTIELDRLHITPVADRSSSRAGAQDVELIPVHKLKACSIATALISKKFRNGEMAEDTFEQLLRIFTGVTDED